MNLSFEEVIAAIRQRPGMYLGRIGQHGYIALFEYFLENFGKNKDKTPHIEITSLPNGWAEIKVEGGPTFLNPDFQNDQNFGSLHSQLGLFVFLAMSEEIELIAIEGQIAHRIVGKKGICEYSKSTSDELSETLWIKFKFDAEVLGEFEPNIDALWHIFRKHCLLNPGHQIRCEDHSSENHSFRHLVFPNGLAHELDLLTSKESHGLPLFKLSWISEIDGDRFQFAIAYMNVWLAKGYQMTYSDNIELNLGGSLLEGILDGLKAAFQAYSDAAGKNFKITRKHVKTQLILLAAVHAQEPEFGGCTRTMLKMPKLKKQVKAHIANHFLTFLQNEPEIAAKIFREFQLIAYDENLNGFSANQSAAHFRKKI